MAIRRELSLPQGIPANLTSRPTSLKEMRTVAEALGVGSQITDKMIAQAENEPPEPSPEELKAEAAMVKAEGETGDRESLSAPFLKSV
jgi:hypothetical protein